MSSRSPSRRGARHNHEAPKCAFQRLMIVHNQLPDMCIDGGLDEGASLDELSESILYYHQDASLMNHDANAENIIVEGQDSHATKDAVQFAGLCSALLSLPDAVVGNESVTDKTREVHLASSTLVFVPLEQNGLIMAVAQVERSSSESFKKFNEISSSTSPLAVRKSIETCHQLFRLIRGGIHYHLRGGSASPEETSTASSMQSSIMNILQSKPDNDIYPGMEELYSLRKQFRGLKRDLSRANDSNRQEEITLSITSLDDKIQSLMETLPIASLRKLLRTHYDEYIADTSLISMTTGILHRCLIENVPAAILRPTEIPTCHYPPTKPCTATTQKMKESVQTLLDKAAKDCDWNEPLLVGMSTFFNGNLIHNHSLPLRTAPVVSAQTAHLLMYFMASYRHKIYLHAQQHSGKQSRKAQSPPRRLGSGLRRLLSASLIDEDTIVMADPGEISICESDEMAHFLGPPPLSMLNVSDQVLQVDLPSHGNVWTPKVYLPWETCGSTLEANLVLMDIGEYSFLLYLRPGKHSVADEEDTRPNNLIFNEDRPETAAERSMTMISSAVIFIPAFSRLLEMVAIDLCNAVFETDEMEGEQIKEDNKATPFSESGQHVVFIDRASQRVVIYSDGDECVRQKARDRKAKPRNEQTSANGSVAIDSRRVLTSNLPLNVVTAFDDLMTQVHERMSSSDEEMLQLCTYMSQGWVYAHAQDDKELYMFFNASKFVTVSDVQHAADRVRTELFDDSVR